MSASTINPHCARQWPHDHPAPGLQGRSIASAREAMAGVIVIARLLQADVEIEVMRDMSSTPEDEAQPFTTSTRSGLCCAMQTCLMVVERSLEGLENDARKGIAQSELRKSNGARKTP